ncbi:hypothetical protein [Arthrobacter roseus]|uniref:hypothetical protein n=1 Tax=Arthrobacter roseus TaxID=136274 RepID=UPI0019651997|nr:hypothetical protein [Arthrobacter roseus]MBM7846924.1 hypothetical protein [Arthrobacter roseus]
MTAFQPRGEGRQRVTGVAAAVWAAAFTEAFGLISPSTLGRVRLKKTAALDDALVAIVYDDWRGDIAGFVFTVCDLNEIDASHRDPVNTARGMVLGELIEPSPHGQVRDVELLRPLNNEFSGIRWWGDVP